MKINKLLSVLVLIALLLPSCTGIASVTTSPETVPEAPPEETSQTLAQPISLEGYRVVISTRASVALKNAAVELKDNLSAQVEGITLANDTKKADGTPEILIGSTDRNDSFDLQCDLLIGEYAIKYFPESGNIAIFGSTDTECLDAIRAFSEVCLDNGSVMSDLFYRSTENPEFTECLLGGVPISEYTVVIPESADNDEKYASRFLSSMIWRKASVSLEITKKASGRCIFVGKTEQTPSEFYVNDAYVLGMSGEDVILCGGGGLTVHAVHEFLEMLFPEGENKSSLLLENAKLIPYEKKELPLLADFGEKPIALTDQKNASIAVYDLVSGKAEPKYEFKPKIENGFTLAGYGNRVDEARLRYSEKLGKYVICYTSSSGYCAVASYPEERCIWQTTISDKSPHSIEYLPNGTIAVACSGGDNTKKGFVRLYSTENKKYAEVKLTSAHALLWDDIRGVLWALGDTQVVAYEVGSAEAPELLQIYEYSHSGMSGGHDMSAIPGDSNRLWVGGAFVRIFDKTTGEFSDNYPGSTQISRSNVKCICAFPDGTAALTVATGVYAAHDTDRFDLFTFGLTIATPTEFVFEGRAFYKARAFIASYD